MNIFQALGWTAGILSAVCFIPYIRDILANKTKPERASWLIWSALGSIAFFSQLDKGATDSLWFTAVQTVGVLIVFGLSIKKGVGGVTTRDVVCLLLALLGLVLWYFTSDSLYALMLVIFVDIIGVYLTTVKSYQHPESETVITWVLAGLSGLFAVFAVGKIDYVLLSYPTYIFLANTVVLGAIFLGKRKR